MAAGIDPATVQFVYFGAGICSSTAFVCWFVWKQLSDNRKLFFRVISRHNREDDDFFALIWDSINAIHMRNAMRDGVSPPDLKRLPRRRYLVDDSGAEVVE